MKLVFNHYKLISKERDSLGTYLSENLSSLEIVGRHLGEDHLDKLILGLAVMQLHLDNSSECARMGNLNGAASYGVEAKLTKDGIYGVLHEAYGGIPKMEGTPKILRDYIMSKYDNGMKKLDLILG